MFFIIEGSLDEFLVDLLRVSSPYVLTVLWRVNLVNTRVTGHEVSSQSHLVSFMQKFELQRVEGNLPGKFLQVVVAEQHSAGS